jgi:hypothetical protein
MLRTLSHLCAGATIITIAGLISAGAQETKKGEKSQIPGGIEGHVKSVDVEKETLTIVTDAGATRTYKVTEDTTMLGPRGGKVRRGLHDRRFHEGMSLTVVASGTTAKEVHLGYSRREPGSAKESGKPTAKAPATSRETSGGGLTTAPAAKTKADTKSVAGAADKAATSEEDDEDDEIPGTVKSYNADRRLLVVSLLNGTNRSFFLSRDLKVLVKGAASKQGVADPSLKEGAHVTVIVEEGGRRVKELHVDPLPPARRAKKAA